MRTWNHIRELSNCIDQGARRVVKNKWNKVFKAISKYQSFLSPNSITPQHDKGSSVLDLLQTLECATWWEIEGEESILTTRETEISMISIQVYKWKKVFQTTV